MIQAVDVPLGSIVAAGSAVLALVVAFLLRRRWPASAVILLLAASGAGLAWGILAGLEGTAAEHALALPLMALLVPFHVRIVLGPLGRRGA